MTDGTGKTCRFNFLCSTLALLPAFLCLAAPSARAEGSKVRVIRENDAYRLTVNGAPFYIQGAGVGEGWGKKGENYLQMAKELGANSVRTWGVDQGSRRYLDEAHRQGLFVDAGIWLDHVHLPASDYTDPKFRERLQKQALDYIKAFKDHPAILTWNVGNEVIHPDNDARQNAAFADFLEDLVQKIHALDPDHPVVYAAKSPGDCRLLKEHTPSLDIVGFNVYGSVISTEGAWASAGMNIPYVITEYGPHGPWDVAKDPNGKATEESDQNKAVQYRNHWNLIRERRGKNLGGYVFQLGETTQESFTYWNINYGRFKKEPFTVLQELYTGKPAANHPPRVKVFEAPAAVRQGAPFDVRIEAEDPDGDAFEYVFYASTTTQYVEKYYANTEIPLRPPKTKGTQTTLTAPVYEGICRIYGCAVDKKNGLISCRSRTLKIE